MDFISKNMLLNKEEDDEIMTGFDEIEEIEIEEKEMDDEDNTY